MTEPQLSVDEALRVVGHLLEHHPTTRSAARDRRGALVPAVSPEAICWCLTGALVVVAERFPMAPSLEPLWDRMAAVLGVSSCEDMAHRWDNDPDWRYEAVEKLKRAGLSTEA